MYRIVQEPNQSLPDVFAFIETIEQAGDLFDRAAEIFLTRAPGRLDVMGGIADYSGSLVLELPIREAALVALQKKTSRDLKIVSLGAEDVSRTTSFEMSLDELTVGGRPIEYAEAKKAFGRDPANSWAAYIAGAFLVLTREKDVVFASGATILIDSKVPEGKGVSSSAAIEVAAMSAIVAAFEIDIDKRDLAVLCQKVENLIVGAPCGIMDQITSACGNENQLLSMICQPAELRPSIEIPDAFTFWGIDSGVRHSVAGEAYGAVRTGACIGYRIIADLAGFAINAASFEGVFDINDPNWSGYLANITPADFEKKFAERLPKEISGEEFLTRYKGITDRLTKVLPDKIYQVYSPTAHPIYENARVRRFADLLANQVTEDNLQSLGDLMFESHKSYSSCGLGSGGTDLLVDLVRKGGYGNGLYGAKITGGGSGGTVAVLGKRGAAVAIKKITRDYKKQTGYQPYVFSGSSCGASAFGCLKLSHAD